MIRFDPRLHIDARTGSEIESMATPLFESPTVVVTDAYPFALAVEIAIDGLLVRAATGEEMTAFLTQGDIPNPDDFAWPGDPALPTGREIEWQEKWDTEIEVDDACRLWSGEIILKCGRGASSPFFVHEAAAMAWAVSEALLMPESEVMELQLVPYACVRRFAPGLIAGGEDEFKRLNRFWMSPVRSWGQIVGFQLPGTNF